MGDRILDSGDESALRRRMEQDASGRTGGGFTGGISISGSSFKSIWNKITGKGETDAKVQVGLIDIPRDGDQAVQKLQDHYQRSQVASDDRESNVTIHPREEDKKPKRGDAQPEMPEHVKKNMEKSLADARDQAKKHGLGGAAQDGGDSSPTDKYAHGAPKNKGQGQEQGQNTGQGNGQSGGAVARR